MKNASKSSPEQLALPGILPEPIPQSETGTVQLGAETRPIEVAYLSPVTRSDGTLGKCPVAPILVDAMELIEDEDGNPSTRITRHLIIHVSGTDEKTGLPTVGVSTIELPENFIGIQMSRSTNRVALPDWAKPIPINKSTRAMARLVKQTITDWAGLLDAFLDVQVKRLSKRHGLDYDALRSAPGHILKDRALRAAIEAAPRMKIEIPDEFVPKEVEPVVEPNTVVIETSNLALAD